MVLQRQTKQFYFSSGIDTRTNPDAIPLGALHSLENAKFRQIGKLSKKNGSTSFPTATQESGVDSGNIPAVTAAFTHNGGLYALGPQTINTDALYNCYPDSLYAWSPKISKWNHICRAASCVAASRKIATLGLKNSGLMVRQDQGSQDLVYCNGYIFNVSAHDSSATGTYVDILDAATGEVVFSNQIGYSYTKVLVWGTYVLVGGINGTNLYCLRFDTTNLSHFPSQVTLATTVGAVNLWDWFTAPVNGNVYVTFGNNAAGVTTNQYASIPASGAAAVTNTVTSANAPVKTLAIFGGESTFNKIIIAYSKTGVGTRVEWASLTLTGVVSVVASTYEARAVTGTTQVDPICGKIIMLGEFDTSAIENYLNITPYYLDASTATITPFRSAKTCTLSLASKVTIQGGKITFLTVTSDPLERTYFLCYLPIDSSCQVGQIRPIAKLLFGQAGFQLGSTAPLGGMLPTLAAGAASTTLYTAGLSYQYDQTPTIDRYQTNLLSFDFAHPSRYQWREVAGLTYFNGGFPAVFDGGDFFEASFLHSPLTPDTVTSNNAGGSVSPSSTYSVVVVFEYVDSYGQRHLSAPSTPVSVTTGAADNRISMRIFPPALSLHNKTNIVFYRTTANGTVYYRETMNYLSCCGTPTTQTLVLADSVLSSQEILYTTGGVLENHCPSASSQIVPWRKRIWALSDDGLNYSKEISSGVPAAFNAAQNLDTGTSKSVPVALAPIQDKLLVFFKDEIYVITGDGPDDTGTSGTFTGPELIYSGVGCIRPTAIVEVGDEVYFQSRDGWRVIDRALQVQYIGGQLQHYITEDSVITSACYIDSVHEVRFSDSLRSYSFDTVARQWIVNTAWADKAGFFWTAADGSRKYIRISTAGVISYEDPTTRADAGGAAPKMRVMTGWISMDQFAGYQRIYEILLLGRVIVPAEVDVILYYDYVPQPVEKFVYTPDSGSAAQFTDADIYEHGWWGGGFYNGNLPPALFRIQPSVQKCSAIRIEISDRLYSDDKYEVELSGLSLIIGVKNGAPKNAIFKTMSGQGRPSFVP